jgi:uncharacterized cupin superfamily protein
MAGKRHPHVVGVDEVAQVASAKGTKYAYERRQLAAAAGGRGLGASHMHLPSGRAGFPRHAHASNEEAIFVLAGRGSVRLGDDVIEIGPGDWVTFPPGPSLPHQVRAAEDAELTYLGLSTMVATDVTMYPDSGKIGLFAGSAPGGAKEERFVDGFHKRGAAVDYWDGEDVG